MLRRSIVQILMVMLGLGPMGCVEIPVYTPQSWSCTIVLDNHSSSTTVRQISMSFPAHPMIPLEYIDLDAGPGESATFQVRADVGTIYLCPTRGAGHGCLRDFWVDDPVPGGVYTLTLTDQNCLSCN